ncbi:MAG: hypothetical protein HOE14_10545 [Gemmatimonadales bacterium]|jgi:hypothetical protein|nr:hypothetical protein [Gemmatimonadales bacterium]
MNITEIELYMLENSQSEEEWNQACDGIKRVRGGNYPRDWYQAVMLSGVLKRATERFS